MQYYQKSTSNTEIALPVMETFYYYSGTTALLSSITYTIIRDADGVETNLYKTPNHYNERFVLITFDFSNYQEGNYTIKSYYKGYLLNIEKLLIYTSFDIFND